MWLEWWSAYIASVRLSSILTLEKRKIKSYCIFIVKNYLEARCWWLMPVILGPQEAEIRRITV
jgi:hypothetical protein